MMDEYDGVAEVWFESEKDLMEAMGSEEMQGETANAEAAQGISYLMDDLLWS